MVTYVTGYCFFFEPSRSVITNTWCLLYGCSYSSTMFICLSCHQNRPGIQKLQTSSSASRAVWCKLLARCSSFRLFGETVLPLRLGPHGERRAVDGLTQESWSTWEFFFSRMYAYYCQHATFGPERYLSASGQSGPYWPNVDLSQGKTWLCLTFSRSHLASSETSIIILFTRAGFYKMFFVWNKLYQVLADRRMEVLEAFDKTSRECLTELVTYQEVERKQAAKTRNQSLEQHHREEAQFHRADAPVRFPLLVGHSEFGDLEDRFDLTLSQALGATVKSGTADDAYATSKLSKVRNNSYHSIYGIMFQSNLYPKDQDIVKRNYNRISLAHFPTTTSPLNIAVPKLLSMIWFFFSVDKFRAWKAILLLLDLPLTLLGKSFFKMLSVKCAMDIGTSLTAVTGVFHYSAHQIAKSFLIDLVLMNQWLLSFLRNWSLLFSWLEYSIPYTLDFENLPRRRSGSIYERGTVIKSDWFVQNWLSFIYCICTLVLGGNTVI